MLWYNYTEHHLNEWNLWVDIKHSDSHFASAKSLAFMLFNSLYRLEQGVFSECSDPYVFVQAARKGKRGVIVVSNTNNNDVVVDFDIKGFATDDVQIIRIDEENCYTLTGETLQDGKLVILGKGCLEIKLVDLK